MRVPNSLPGSLCFCLQLPPPEILLGRVPLKVFELRPSVLQELRDDIDAIDLAVPDISGYVFVRRERVRCRKRDRLADSERTEELSGFKRPGLSQRDVMNRSSFRNCKKSSVPRLPEWMFPCEVRPHLRGAKRFRPGQTVSPEC